MQDSNAQEIDHIEIEIEKEIKEGQAHAKKKVKAVTDSLDRLAQPSFNGLLGETEEKQSEAPENKRGPKINEDVQVKICDMGNGCWTYHHFTPEIQTR